MKEEKNYDSKQQIKCYNIPSNIFKKNNGHEFKDEIEEIHAWEQFFWTCHTVHKLMEACKYIYIDETCCLTTPSLAHGWSEVGRNEVLLDIDTRFNYLPKFKYYDIHDPQVLNQTFRLLIFDPPFFLIPMEQLLEAVNIITNNNYTTKIMMAFLKRAEKELRFTFKKYDLMPTNFELQYVSIKPSKWSNFCLYSNIDLPGIKRIK